MDYPTQPLGTLPPQLPHSTHYVTPAPTNQAWCAPDDSDPDEELELPPIAAGQQRETGWGGVVWGTLRVLLLGG